MSQEGAKKLMDLWINDPAFRTKLRKNPDQAVRDSGVKLSKEEQDALRSVDWSISDEELQARASKTVPI
jgi:hypothetical protein